ncbi:Aldolase-type TIM barrel family protein [Zea mays]|uniref:Aldolase-type TIM barrel family protein n=1 Tax=Zea mays TaxID=4577 RepID=A0A1D6N2L0_MAIZE|nr:Aldolase-type TIM barrel family protein [Zea mays]
MTGTVSKLAAPRPAAPPLRPASLRAAAIAFAPSPRRVRVSVAGRARIPSVIAMASAKEGNGAPTKKTSLHDLYELQGLSPWYDNLCRPVTDLLPLIASGVRGVTSNPAIFQKAISSSSAYDDQFKQLISGGKDAESAYWELVIKDIQDACSLFEPIYDETDGADGYVSVELIFSIARYEAVIDAYLDGLEASGLSDLSRVTSVASFFVSRVDTLIDKMLEKIGTPEALALRGKAAVAQAKLANRLYQKKFSGPRWEALAKKGAKKQRLLWASTGVKNPAYPDTLYIDSLIGPDTVNTMPDQALHAFIDHGTVSRTVDANVSEAEGVYSALEKLGIDWGEVGKQLELEGVDSFKKSFDSLLVSLQEKGNSLKTATV